MRSTNDFSEVLLPKEFSGKGKTAASPQTKKKKISDQEGLKKAKRRSVLGMADDIRVFVRVFAAKLLTGMIDR